ncbi:MAG: hypothetical protein ACRD0Q_07725 [Acidimicrobiales bacterium]
MTSRAGGTGERGSSPVSSSVGFLVFIVMLLFAVSVLLRLYATSVVSAVAYDAARRVAASAGDQGAVADAEGQARRLLGRYGRAASFDWDESDGDSVVVRVRAATPQVLPALSRAAGLDAVERTVRVRVERFR